jgi:hypothetical protein
MYLLVACRVGAFPFAYRSRGVGNLNRISMARSRKKKPKKRRKAEKSRKRPPRLGKKRHLPSSQRSVPSTSVGGAPDGDRKSDQGSAFHCMCLNVLFWPNIFQVFRTQCACNQIYSQNTLCQTGICLQRPPVSPAETRARCMFGPGATPFRPQNHIKQGESNDIDTEHLSGYNTPHPGNRRRAPTTTTTTHEHHHLTPDKTRIGIAIDIKDGSSMMLCPLWRS